MAARSRSRMRQVADEPRPGLVNVPGAKTQHEIAVLDLPAGVLVNAPDIGLKLNMRMSVGAHRVHDHLAGHTGNRFFAGRIDIGDEDAIGLVEGSAELLLESERARIAVGLKHHQHTLPAAGASGRDGGGNLGRMVPVVVDDQVALCFVADFKATSCASEVFERGGDLLERESDFDGQSDHRQRIHRVVDARDVQAG